MRILTTEVTGAGRGCLVCQTYHQGRQTLGRDVAIVGAGVSNFGAFPEKNSRELFAEAFKDLLASVDNGVQLIDVDALYVGNMIGEFCEGQSHMGAILADTLGLVPKPATRIEGACASSSMALREGILSIASGWYDIVLVGGVEKMTNMSTEQATDALASGMDVEYEIPAGLTFPGIYAAMASVYIEKYGATTEQFMKVAIKNHENGSLNPKAHFNCSIKDILDKRIRRSQERGNPLPDWKDELDFLHDDRENPIIAWPLRLFDCSPITDGASCLLLVAGEKARSFTAAPIYIIGSGQASDYPLYVRKNLTSLGATKAAAREAYATAGGVSPKDVQIAEVHDCFTIAEIIAIEDLGFFSPGEGVSASDEGETALGGAKPINTSGGLKAKGHPVGATGTAQVVEIWHQMRGTAGDRQVPTEINLALTHNAGGSGCTCLVHIFERR